MSPLGLVPQPGPAERPADLLGEPLTRSELIVLENLSLDATLEEIAAKLWVSRNTVKTQLHSVYRKIGVSTRADAVAWAAAAGLSRGDFPRVN